MLPTLLRSELLTKITSILPMYRDIDLFVMGRRKRGLSRSTSGAKKMMPLLFALPPHLRDQILAYLDEPYDLSLIFLRRTHPILRRLIPQGYSSNRTTKKCQLWTAEREHPYLFPPDFYPCYSCLEVYPLRCFEPRYRSEEGMDLDLERRCKFCTRMWDRRFLSAKRFDDLRRRARL